MNSYQDIYLIEDCSHSDPLMSLGRTGATPGRGGGTETLASAPNGTKVILQRQKDQMYVSREPGRRRTGRRKYVFLFREGIKHGV